MNYPIRDDWQKKGKKYRTKYLDCLKELCRRVEEEELKQSATQVMNQFAGALKDLADK
jgi:hypothetical protein